MSEFVVYRTLGNGRCLVLDGTRIAGGKPDYRGNNFVTSWVTNKTYGPVDELKSENDKLREELEQWHKLTAGIELPEYPITQFQPKDLERENAKLRNEVELTKRMYAKVSEDLCAEQADNERLRQELAIREESEQEKCIEYLRQENIDWEDRYRTLAEENAKLRELMARVEHARRDLCDAYPDAEMLNCEECPAWSACRGDLMDHMRELGIEVD